MSNSLLVYGAYGYTGKLVVEEALRAGLRPTIAGRDANKIREMSRDLGLPGVAFSLDDSEELHRALEPIEVVLHCAGPFHRTSKPMADACLETGTHYLDITGEIEVFESLAARNEQARKNNVMLLPGCGFDVVPTDCMAAHLKSRLPDASKLRMAFSGGGGISRGTLNTMIDNLGEPGAIRRDGKIIPVPPAYDARKVDFGRGPWQVVTIPWGDVSTAFHTTGIPDIRIYTAVKPSAVKWLKASRHLGWLLRRKVVKKLMRSRIESGRPGPDPRQRERSNSYIWGSARNAAGHEVSARMIGPNGYSFTATSAVAIAARVLDGNAKPGFQTPAGLFGPDLALELGFSREILD